MNGFVSIIPPQLFYSASNSQLFTSSQTEDCAYASNSKDPDNQHVSYSESSSYGDSKRRGYDKHDRSKPGKKHQRGGDTFDIGFDSEFDSIELDSDRGNSHDGSARFERGSSQARGPSYSEEGEKSATTKERAQPGRYQIPGTFKAGRFRDAYITRARSRRKRHAGHDRIPISNSSGPGSDDYSGTVDDSHTGRALARFLSDEEHHHAAEPRSREIMNQHSQRHSEELPEYSEDNVVPLYRAGSPPAQRRSGGYHVRGVVPEYHRRVESSTSSGGGYDEYANGDAKERPHPLSNADEDYDNAGYGLDGKSETIGDLFDYRFGKQPIDGRFAERLEKEREDESAEYDYQYDDSEGPEYEDSDARDDPEYDYDYQQPGQDYEHREKSGQRRSTPSVNRASR